MAQAVPRTDVMEKNLRRLYNSFLHSDLMGFKQREGRVFPGRRTPTERKALPVAGALLGVVALVVEAVVEAVMHGQMEREAEGNLHQIAIAMHSHYDTFNSLPAPASVDSQGKPLLSWRVPILPFIEQDALYRKFRLDEPWDSPTNKELIKEMPKVYESHGGKPLKPG